MKQIALWMSTLIFIGAVSLFMLGMGTVEKKTPSDKSTRGLDNQVAEAKSELPWNTDFDKALADAKEAKKPIFALFTGSDWCPWCVKLEDEVLSKQAFQDYAKDAFVMFKADFLRKTKMDPELRKKNAALTEKYNVEGFPSVILLDSEGKKIAATGYQSGGAESYVDHLKSLMKDWQDAPKK